MKMEVVVDSIENIKPSSPTPHHLLRFQFSSFDQLPPPAFIPYLLFYSKGPENQIASTNLQKSNQLKQSLSSILTSFYPVAGRIKVGYAECNDAGVPFFEARADRRLSEILGESSLYKFNSLLPFADREDAGDLPFAVQATFFECGGVVIGNSFNHRMFDAVSMCHFVNCWAAKSRGDQPVYPILDLPKLFPLPNPQTSGRTLFRVGFPNMAGKRFLFSGASISVLQARFSGEVKPTRVEALSAFLWSKFTGNSSKIYVGYSMVNLRTRMNPPFSDSYFGNFISSAMIGSSADVNLLDGSVFSSRFRASVKRIDEAFIRRFHKMAGMQKKQAEAKAELIILSFNNVSAAPMYESDFGWGRPELVTVANVLLFKNSFMFAPTKSGSGIEVLAFFGEDEINRLEADPEFCELASIKPRFKSSL